MANQTCNPSIITQALGITATGPRTVIVPADPIIWDAETSYEYLTLVASTDFGQAYISKKDVPAGTELTNTEYWIPAATYNAQLAAIQAQLAEVTPEVKSLSTQVTGIVDGIPRSMTVSLANIGGKEGDETFDNATIIESYMAEHPMTNLYVPTGNWYIGHTLEVSGFDVYCDGFIVPSASFVASFPHNVISDNPYTIGGAQYAPVVCAMKEDENTTWNHDWVYRRNWKIKLDLNNVTHTIGFYINSCFGCNVNLFVYRFGGGNVGFSQAPNNVECTFDIACRYGSTHLGVTSDANRSTYGVIHRTSDCKYNTLVVSDCTNGVYLYKQEFSCSLAHIIDCDNGINVNLISVSHIDYYYADHLDCIIFTSAPISRSYLFNVDCLYVVIGDSTPSILNGATSLHVVIGAITTLDSAKTFSVLSNAYNGMAAVATQPIEILGTALDNNVTDLTLDSPSLVTAWPCGTYVFNSSSAQNLKAFLTKVGFPTTIGGAALNATVRISRIWSGVMIEIIISRTIRAYRVVGGNVRALTDDDQMSWESAEA